MARSVDFRKQAGKSMMVDMLGDDLVSEVLAHDGVVQAACTGRRTFPAVQGPVIGGVPSLARCETILQDVIHCQQEAFFVLSWRQL